MSLASFDRSPCAEKHIFGVDQFQRAVVFDFSSHWEANVVPGMFERHNISPFGVYTE